MTELLLSVGLHLSNGQDYSHYVVLEKKTHIVTSLHMLGEGLIENTKASNKQTTRLSQYLPLLIIQLLSISSWGNCNNLKGSSRA